jgi:subtilisin family serine protease
MQYMETEKARGLNVVATNNSYGGCPEACEFDQASYDAIESNMRKGILFIAAAGNDRRDNDSVPTYPASYLLPNVIAVTATDDDDALARFSNFGDRTVLVAAPGVRIGSTSPRDAYSFSSGTSMAAPHVTGLAALLKAQGMRRDWWKVRNLILAGGDDKPSLAGRTVTGRRINAFGSATCSGRPFFGVLRPLDKQAGQPIPLAALNIRCARRVTGSLTVTITPGEATVTLVDDGTGLDLAPEDGVFSGAWSPSPCTPGSYTFSFSTGASVQAAITC